PRSSITLNISSWSSDFNDNNHDQINSSSFNIYEQDVTANFSPPCFDTYELDANAFLSDFSYEHNIANAQPKSAENNEHEDNEQEDNEHEDNEHEDL
ncbi:23722_t:CDS:2, partial [Gigaspora rosea]